MSARSRKGRSATSDGPQNQKPNKKRGKLHANSRGGHEVRLGKSSDSFGDGIIDGKSSKKKKGSKSAKLADASDSRSQSAPYPNGLPTDRPLDVNDYFDQLHLWLDLEAEAERARLARLRQIRSQRDVESTGQAIVGLDLVDYHTGLAGRYLLDLAKPSGEALPMNRLKVGSPVVLSNDADPSDEGIPGVVSFRKNYQIQIATEVFPDPDAQNAKTGKASKHKRASIGEIRYRLDMSPDETTRKRQLAAMAKARGERGRGGRLRDVLLGIESPRFDGKKIDVSPLAESTIAEERADIDFRTELNPPQKDAVAFALLADDFAIIHGPPGTGKTTTLAEVISQAVERGERVLACAASNTAVDNLLERLERLVPYVVRVGHPARVFEHLRDLTLDGQVEKDPSSAVIKDLRRELEQLLRYAQRDTRGGRARGEMFAEVGRIRSQIRSLERTIVRGVLDRADVICTTTTIDEELLGDERFDLIVIDEACQSTEGGMWQAILRADRLIIAGDHCQLPPTVLSDEAAEIGMRDSLMQRLVHRFGEPAYRRLTVQYRMHESIMRFSSDHFYEGSLVADASVRSHLLCDLKNVATTSLTDTPLLWIDTAGAGYEEQLEPDGQSKLNPGEANVIVELVRQLEEAGIDSHEIAIIAPYAAQVRLLRSRLDMDGLEIDTVDGFQGREKEVVLLTMVRSNPEGIIGFLADQRRSNVAMTRAKRKLIMVGDSATLCSHDFYADVLKYFEDANAYQSVFEFQTLVPE
ncbi:AAA domain-containing protein [Rhodopirellula sp. SWK7]|uniref:AAA domain-containing protein n=1 Tax=Rhodopirellula sp. SWK7 TaxID=595460 RepID=UPI0002BE3E8D|nr:AAA domain-containing protein [Rhodopirellula sp. SWK7]EMI41859.1 DNA-binding protein SMUBP-2 [Rhodopirellula sp. SWK7]